MLAARSLRAKGDAVKVAGLKVEYLDRPIGLEIARPCFSWQLESSLRNVRQTAFQILVASSESNLKAGIGDLWDSGKVPADTSFEIGYEGRELRSRQRCWWTVIVWSTASVSPSVGEASWWEMGLLEDDDWSASWLAAENSLAREDRTFGLQWVWGEISEKTQTRLFRRKFELSGDSTDGEMFADVNHARANITGIWIDGNSVERTDARAYAGQWFSVQGLEKGTHVIAIAVDVSAIRGGESGYAFGLTMFGRFALRNGGMTRIGCESSVTLAGTTTPDWITGAFDDSSWSNAGIVDVGDHQPWPPRPAQDFRHDFRLGKRVVNARLYSTALGAYEARINGVRIGDALLTPEISQYEKRLLYRAFVVDPAVFEDGGNVFALTVGDGWYASWDGNFSWAPPPRRVLAQLELTFDDGTREVLTTGPGWRTEQSPIRRTQMRIGELYDARYEHPGWDVKGFDDSTWEPAAIADAPDCKIVAQTSPPIRAVEEMAVQAITKLKDGVYVFDLGQNFSGWCRLRVIGLRGIRVQLDFAEMLQPDGDIDQQSMAVEWFEEPKTDVYILKGDPGGEIFEPKFTYRGFRYVRVSGLPDEPTAGTLTGIFAHTDLTRTGVIHCSQGLIEEIWRKTLDTQRSNFVAIPTDCPSREQRGWMGDAGLFWDAAAFNMDVCAFGRRQMDNVRDRQSSDGAFPMMTPWPERVYQQFFGIPGTAPAWADGGVIVVWTTWQRYGDLSIVRRNWPAMKRYLQFIQDNNPDWLWKNARSADFGDWMSVGATKLGFDIEPTTPKEVIATAYWANSAALMAQMARALNENKAAERYLGVFGNVRKAFNTAYVGEDGSVGNNSQTSLVLPLAFGLLEGEVRSLAERLLVKDVESRGGALTTGILGTQFILDVLANAGRPDLAYELLLRTDYPSWGYMFQNGATAIWENWTGEFEYVRGNPAYVSRNHYALGSVCGFLFRRMAGISSEVPGFRRIVIRPLLDERITEGGGEYHSVLGRISTYWKQESPDNLRLAVAIPPNAVATVHIPATRKHKVFEGRTEIALRNDMRILSRSNGAAVVELGSGDYQFVVDG